MCIATIVIVIYRLIFIREGLFRLDAQRQFGGVKHDTTHVSQSEHSDQPRHSAATTVNGISAMRAQRVDALGVNALLKPAKL